MFYDNFVELCEKKGVSRTKACVDCNVSRTAWRKWEGGGTPNGTTLNAFADYFGVTTDYLLTGEQEESAITLIEAKRKLSIMVEDDPSMPSSKRLNFLFDEADYDPVIISYNLDIDQAHIDRWLNRGTLPPKPIVDKILGVFQMSTGELLNDEELAAYEEENKEWGKVPSDSKNKKVPTLVSESGPARNIIKIAGRDGSFVERELTDEQVALMKNMLDQLKPIDDDHI